jgi:hypothetical protein
VIDWTDGQKHDFLGGATVNGQRVSNMFRKDDAKRLIAAVRERKAAMGGQ